MITHSVMHRIRYFNLRVTFEECIEEMGRKVSKSMVELKRMAQDRKKWVLHRGPPDTN